MPDTPPDLADTPAPTGHRLHTGATLFLGLSVLGGYTFAWTHGEWPPGRPWSGTTLLLAAALQGHLARSEPAGPAAPRRRRRAVPSVPRLARRRGLPMTRTSPPRLRAALLLQTLACTPGPAGPPSTPRDTAPATASPTDTPQDAWTCPPPPSTHPTPPRWALDFPDNVEDLDLALHHVACCVPSTVSVEQDLGSYELHVGGVSPDGTCTWDLFLELEMDSQAWHCRPQPPCPFRSGPSSGTSVATPSQTSRARAGALADLPTPTGDHLAGAASLRGCAPPSATSCTPCREVRCARP